MTLKCTKFKCHVKRIDTFLTSALTYYDVGNTGYTKWALQCMSYNANVFFFILFLKFLFRRENLSIM